LRAGINAKGVCIVEGPSYQRAYGYKDGVKHEITCSSWHELKTKLRIKYYDKVSVKKIKNITNEKK